MSVLLPLALTLSAQQAAADTWPRRSALDTCLDEAVYAHADDQGATTEKVVQAALAACDKLVDAALAELLATRSRFDTGPTRAEYIESWRRGTLKRAEAALKVSSPLSGEAKPASASPETGEIVVSAVYGRTTMLFDKGSDGKLRNCRIMVSSGSQKRDTDACQATPVCYAGTAAEVVDCVPLSLTEPVLAPRSPAPPATGGPQVFTMPQLVKPVDPVKVSVGPAAPTDESRLTQAQRVNNLPPPPKAPSDGPVIRLGAPDDATSSPPPIRPF